MAENCILRDVKLLNLELVVMIVIRSYDMNFVVV